MKTIIAGSRTLYNSELLRKAIELSEFEITEVVSGGALGVDRLGEQWAHRNNIPIKKFRADWDAYGKSAGVIRNRQMAEYAEQLIAIWDGKSKGTANMIAQARAGGLKVYVYTVTNP